MTALTLVACPDCGAPAEITERFCLPSTDGPVDHVGLDCVLGHHFRMAEDMLPTDPPPLARPRYAAANRLQDLP